MSHAEDLTTTRESLEALLARLADLAHSPMTPSLFHARLLEELVQGLAMTGGAVWTESALGGIEAGCQIAPEAVQLTTSEKSRRMHSGLIDATMRHPQPRVVPARGHDGTWDNQSDHHLYFQPLTFHHSTRAVLELFQPDVDDAPVAPGVLRVLGAVAEIASEYYLRDEVQRLERTVGQARQREQYWERIFRPEGTRPLAYTAVHETRPLLKADRISLCECRGKRCRLLAVSGVDSVERRAEAVRIAERLAEAAVIAGPVWFPDESASLAPQLESILEQYVESTAALAVAVIPLVAELPKEDSPEDEQQPEFSLLPCGVLIADWYSEGPDPTIRERIADIARPLGLALHRNQAFDRLPLLGVTRTLRDLGWQRGVGGWRKLGVGIIALIVLALALFVVPAELTVTAPGRIEPHERVDLFAPRNGVVVELPVRHGKSVSQGELIAALRSPELDRQMNEVQGRLRTVEETLAAIRATRLQQGGRGAEGRGLGQISTQEVEMEVTRQGLQEQWELLSEERDALRITSPFHGQVVTWDVRDLLARPVSHGEFLMRVARLEGSWRLELEIPEHRAGHVLNAFRTLEPGQKLPVEYLLETSPQSSYSGWVTGMADSIHLNQHGLPVVLVEVSLPDDDVPRHRPGATVHARVACGSKSLGYVWFHRLYEAIYMAGVYRF